VCVCVKGVAIKNSIPFAPFISTPSNLFPYFCINFFSTRHSRIPHSTLFFIFYSLHTARPYNTATRNTIPTTMFIKTTITALFALVAQQVVAQDASAQDIAVLEANFEREYRITVNPV